MHESGGDRAFEIIIYVVLILLALMMIYPLYFVLIASVSDPFDVVNGRVFLWVKNFSLDSYKQVMNNSLIWTGYVNSIINTAFTVVYNLVVLHPRGLRAGQGSAAGEKAC